MSGGISGDLGPANNGSAGVDALGATVVPAQCVEIGHCAARIAEGVTRAVSGDIGATDNGSAVVDAIAYAVRSTKCAQVSHYSARITESVLATTGVGQADDGAGGIDPVGQAEASAERTQIGDAVENCVGGRGKNQPI